MSGIVDALQSFINGQANKLLAPYGLTSSGAPSMGLPISVSGSAQSSSSTGPSKSGDISGGTAFNIGGINLGTQYQTPVTAEGGNPGGLLGSVAGSNSTTLIIVAVAALAIFLIMRK